MAEKLKNKLGRRPRRPREMSKTGEKKLRKELREEGMTDLRTQDAVVRGAKRALRGTSPPYLPGETELLKRSTKQSKPFSDQEIKQGFRRLGGI